MELDDLAAVLATAESGSITAAATRLHVAQPALSRRIARLERTLGGPLFVRGRHGAHPTAAGEVLVAGAGEVVASLRDVERRTRDALAGRAGRLRIGTTPTLGADLLPPVLAAHRRGNPDVELEITSSGDSAWLAAAVADRRLDVALAVRPEQRAGGLRMAATGAQTFVLAMPSGHRLATKHSVEHQALVGERLVVLRAGEGLRQLVDRLFVGLGAEPLVSIETSDREMLLPLVVAGLGVTLLPRRFAEARVVEGVELRPLRPAVRRDVAAIVRDDDEEPLLAGFLDELRRGWPDD